MKTSSRQSQEPYLSTEIADKLNNILNIIRKNRIHTFFLSSILCLIVYGVAVLTTWILHIPIGFICELIAGDFLRSNIPSLSGLNNQEFRNAMGDIILESVLIPISTLSQFFNSNLPTGLSELLISSGSLVIGGLVISVVFLLILLLPVIIGYYIYKLWLVKKRMTADTNSNEDLTNKTAKPYNKQ